MEEFYDKIKSDYENRDLPNYREADWKDMESRLDRDLYKNKLGFYWWLMIPLLGLLSWNIYLYVQLKEMRTTSVVSMDIEKERQITDTVIREKIILVRDTIFRESIKWLASEPEIIEKVVYVQRSATADQLAFTLNPSWKTSQGKEVSISEEFRLKESERHNLGQFSSLSEDRRYYTTNPLKSLPKMDFQALSSISSEEKFRARVKNTPYLNSSTIQSSWRRKLENSFSPVSLRVEIGAGATNAHNSDLIPIVGTSLNAGLFLGFKPGYRLWLDVAIHRMELKSNFMDEELGIPIVTPPSDEYEFDHAKVPRVSIQYSAGLDYTLRKTSRLRPVFGIGWGSVKYLPSEVLYDFTNMSNGLEFTFEKNIPAEEIHHHYLIGKLGLEYSITKRSDLALSGFYRRGWNDPIGLNHLVGGSLSVKTRIY